jgi:4-amino-4-deoxy-L-arabinose transferase-like glycosyltransferase
MDVRPRLGSGFAIGFALFLAVLAFALFFYRSSAVGLLGPDEPRYAQVAREMLHTGDFLTPHLQGQPWFEKPPLFYWMEAASFYLFGVNEAAARLPSALTATAFLILFAWLTLKLFPGETWRYATLILLSSIGWIGFGRAATMEMLFASSLAGALGFLGLWVWQGRRRWLFAFHGLLAISVLAKGLAGIVVAALILVVYCAITGEYRWLLRVVHPLPVTLFAVIALPWYGAVYFKNGDLFVQEFIVKHHFRRFLTNELAHPAPWWYYGPVLLAGIFPWTAHVASLRVTRFDRDNRRTFLLVWVAVVLVFFSVSQAKLPGYILPALPAFALWMGEEWKRASRGRIRAIGAAQGALLLLLALAGSLPSALAAGLTRAHAQVSGTGTMFALTAAILVWFTFRARRFGAVVLVSSVTAAAMLWVAFALAPQMDQEASARPIARVVCGKNFALGDVRRHILYGLEFYCDRPLTNVAHPEYVLSSTPPPGSLPAERFPEAGLTLWKLFP